MGRYRARMNQNPARTFGEGVAAQIEAQGLSLREAADASGIPWSTFHRKIRSQATSFTLGELTALAHVLGTTPEAIVADWSAAA